MSDQSDIDVEQLIAAGEGEHLELRSGVTDAGAMARSIAGLANSGGGRLVLGVDQGSERLVGLTDPAAAERTLDSAAKLITPGVDVRMHRAGTPTHPVIIADIAGATGRPVADPDGALIRRGPSGGSVPLGASELARVATDAADPFNEMLSLLVEANKAVVHLQQTLDQERKDAAAERTAAKRSRSFGVQLVGWIIAGVIGAILGGIVTVLLS